MTASLEHYSKHPLSQAMLEAAQNANLPVDLVSEISERPGEGLRGKVGNRSVWITNRQKVIERQLALPPVAPGLECLLFIDDIYAATFRFHDMPRQESRTFVKHLRPRHAVNRVLIVSGDRDQEVRHLAEQVGITEIYSAKSPEDKLAIVCKEAAQAPTLFLGDGINDAPALGRVDELIHIARRMRRIALQSAIGGMALSILGMFAAAFGYLPPIGGAITQEIIDLAAVLNAVRVALPTHSLTDF
jgi:P-type E1-E2 ATPase